MDIKDAGPLAGVVRYGVPWHGRIEGGVMYTGKLDALGAEVTRAWPQPASGDCWLIRAPQKQTVDGVTTILPGTTLPDPYLDAAAAKTADALEGKELTNYALVSGAGNIHGKAFTRSNDDKHRWIWIDDNGDAFSVVFGLVGGTQQLGATSDYDGFTARDWSFAGPVTARFKIKRFGDLRQEGLPAAATVTVSHELTAAGMGQDAPPLTGLYIVDGGPYSITGGNMILRDLSSTGDKAIMEIHSNVFDTALNWRIFGTVSGRPFVSHREYSNPLGFVQFTLSGTGAAPVVSMSVLATRATALGAQSHTRPSYSMTSAWVCDNCATLGDVVTCHYACSWHEVAQTVALYTGRVVGYGFDAGGVPQPHLMTRREQYDEDRTVTPTTAAAGTYARTSSIQTTVTITVGANVYTLEDSIATSESAGLAGGVCTPAGTTTYSSNSGAPGANYATDTGSNCNLIVWDSPLPQADCGTACRVAASFTPRAADRLHREAFTLPTRTSEYLHPSGVFRLGSSLYAVMWGVFSDEKMGAACLISRHQKDVDYTVWDNTRDAVLLRFYGARNPATGEIAWPKAAPVNFA